MPSELKNSNALAGPKTPIGCNILPSKRVALLTTPPMPTLHSSAAQQALAAELEAFRQASAQARQVAATRILSHAQLRAISKAAPQDLDELLAIKGVGRKTVELVGEELVRICRTETASPAHEPASAEHREGPADEQQPTALGRAAPAAPPTASQPASAHAPQQLQPADAHCDAATFGALEDMESVPRLSPARPDGAAPTARARATAKDAAVAIDTDPSDPSDPSHLTRAPALEPAAAPPAAGTWQWMGDDGAFIDYRTEDNAALEAAHASSASQAKLAGTHAWLVDLVHMTQRNTSDAYGRTAPVRTVRRVPAPSAVKKRQAAAEDSAPGGVDATASAQPAPPPAPVAAKRARPSVTVQRVAGAGTDPAAVKAMVAQHTAAQQQRLAAAAGAENAGVIPASKLSDEQIAAAERALRGESLFLTGAAGTGKSFLLKFIIQELRKRHGDCVAVTAPTGIAAINVGGITIHSFAGIGHGRGTQQEILQKVKKNSKARKNWLQTKCLVVDEISMLSSDAFDLLDFIGQNMRPLCGRGPFGGLQLILCGDFFQLPPVHDHNFAFQSEAWRAAGLAKGSVVLRHQHRQGNDPTFAMMLNELRVGVLTDKTMGTLHACMEKAKPTDGILPTRLYCTNRDVDRENELCLSRLGGDAVTFRCRDTFKGSPSSAQKRELAKKMESKICENLSLKVGAQVILLQNDHARGLANGSRGVVVALDPVSDTDDKLRPTVRFDSGQEATLDEEYFNSGTSTQNISRLQIPLKLGWALTVHKSQGMTLSRAEVDVSGAFACGQAYVALSRVTGTAGLWMRGRLQQKDVRVSEHVKRFYGVRMPSKPSAQRAEQAKPCAAAAPLTSGQVAQISANREKALALLRARKQRACAAAVIQHAYRRHRGCRYCCAQA